MGRPGAEDASAEIVRVRTLPLLAGYWSFGQFWGAIFAVATIGYTGFVWSPPLLGWIAETADLRAAMAVVELATFGITATGIAAGRGRS